ncbi:MAG: sugar phosphate isomerase/epimerase [Planctomycetota bacterium]
MTEMRANTTAAGKPLIGIAGWLIAGPLPDRIRWSIENGFTGFSLLQSAMESTESERIAAAALLRQTGLNLTYHGNVHHRRTPDGGLDWDFARQVIDDVRWWNASGALVQSVCFDPIYSTADDSPRRFETELNAEYATRLLEAFKGTDTRVGIENGFGQPGGFAAIRNFRAFLDRFPSDKPGMLLDLGHANIHVQSEGMLGETDIGEYIRAIPFEILEVHVSGNFGAKDEHFGLGYGNVDIPSAFSALKRRGYTRQTTVEVCVDILNGKYAAALQEPKQVQPLLESLDIVRSAIARA